MVKVEKFEKDAAVSPVIGTILLVAITVAVVAIVAAVVMGMASDAEQKISNTHIISVKVVNDENNTVVIFIGGDVDKIESWKIASSNNPSPYESSSPKIGVPYNTGFRFTGDTLLTAKFSAGEQIVWSGKL